MPSLPKSKTSYRWWFIPRDRYDTRSPSHFIETNRQRLPEDLLIGDLGTAAIDWERYNLLDAREADNVRFCHPSPYGHQKIADLIAELLKTAMPGPARAEAPRSLNSGNEERPRS